MTRSPKSFASPLRRGRRLRRPGSLRSMRKQPGSRLRRSSACGRLSTSNLTAPRGSNFNRSSVSSRRCAISSGFICSRPEQAVVLCVDEKSQALDRPQPLRPRPAPAFLSTGCRGEGATRGREVVVDELAPGRRARAHAGYSASLICFRKSESCRDDSSGAAAVF